MRRAGPLPAVLALVLAALLVPVAITHLPPLYDYPNHLSRLWLIGGGAATPPLSGIYAVEWSALTNIGIDLLAVPLTRIFPAEAVAKLYLGLGIVLVPLGAALLHRALHGRLHWWSLAFPVLVWNGAVLAGFLNFQIAMGLALVFAAADPWLARRGQAALLPARALAAALLVVVHLFGLVFYAALLCGLALGPDLRALRHRAGLRAAALRLLPVVGLVVLVLGAFLLTAPALPGAHAAANAGSVLGDIRAGLETLFARHKLKSALSWIWTYHLPTDAAVLLLLAVPPALALWRGRLHAHGGLLLVALALVLLFLVTPFRLAGTFWVDRRFAYMAPFVLAVALRPEVPAALLRPAATLLLALGLGRAGFIGLAWQARQADVAAVERVLALVPPGAAILPFTHVPPPRDYGPFGRHFSGGEPSYGHYPTIAIRTRQAFVPTLFTARGKQPLRVLPPWNGIAVPEGWLVTPNILADAELQRRMGWEAPYARLWRERFDYILVVNADMPDHYGPFRPPEGVALLADAGFAQLWRIDRSPPAATAARE
ncbi:hypothetical protein [Paracraurococcus ruber]|uniref:Uncharacterized protein n=1 Tax=Paracraurococcus ruber TaxID=77675 RepID=A0ABS1CT63_9PROT|nr:hypothetical protein [Paracraurococcus ruber]MBK1657034.1 hypothetical protein [Paracraurococcus ruber]TDG32524.1 hypothetical protein E2C05_06705 [Paracraurococcus ruber]